MNARPLILFAGLAALSGIAYAAIRRPDTSGEGVDWPDAPAAPWLDPVALFDDAAGAVLGDVMTAQRLSPDGLERLKVEEGFSEVPYYDFKGYSIGYGHLIKGLESFESITEEEAAALLASDVEWAEQAVSTSVHAPLTPNQFDALVLLAYNIGAGAFRSSTLVRLLNAGDFDGAAAQFPRWINAGGRVNTALVSRRQRERALFEG